MLFKVSGLESDGSWSDWGEQNIGLDFAAKTLLVNGMAGTMDMINITIGGKEIFIICEKTTLKLEKPYWGPYN